MRNTLSTVEYGLLAGLIIVVAIAAYTLLGGNVHEMLGCLVNQLLGGDSTT